MNKRKTPFVRYGADYPTLLQTLLLRGGYIPKPTKPRFSSRLSAFLRKLFS